MARIDQVQIVPVPVGDQERARDFYVNVLGFELRADDTWGEGMRWIEVAPKGSATSLTLVTWFESMPPGSLQGLVVATDDIEETYQDLAAKGVPFDFPPAEQPGGKQAVFRDPTATGWCSGAGGRQRTRPVLTPEERSKPAGALRGCGPARGPGPLRLSG